MERTNMSAVLNGFVEAERNYRQTLDRIREESKLAMSDRRLKVMEKAALLGNGMDMMLTPSEERALRRELDRLAESEWNENQLGALLHRHQNVEPKQVEPRTVTV